MLGQLQRHFLGTSSPSRGSTNTKILMLHLNFNSFRDTQWNFTIGTANFRLHYFLYSSPHNLDIIFALTTSLWPPSRSISSSNTFSCREALKFMQMWIYFYKWLILKNEISIFCLLHGPITTFYTFIWKMNKNFLCPPKKCNAFCNLQGSYLESTIVIANINHSPVVSDRSLSEEEKYP